MDLKLCFWAGDGEFLGLGCFSDWGAFGWGAFGGERLGGQLFFEELMSIHQYI